MADDTGAAPTADDLIAAAQRRSQVNPMPTITVTAPAAPGSAAPNTTAPTAESLIADAAKRSQVGNTQTTDSTPPASVNGDSIAPGLRATIATDPNYRYGQIWPLKQNLDTGTLEMAWPGMAHQFANGVLDLAEGPLTGDVTPEGTAALTSMTPANAARAMESGAKIAVKIAAKDAKVPGILSDAFKSDPFRSAVPPSETPPTVMAGETVSPTGIKIPTDPTNPPIGEVAPGSPGTSPSMRGGDSQIDASNAGRVVPDAAPVSATEQKFLDLMHSQVAPWMASTFGSTVGTGIGALAGGPLGALAGTIVGMPAGMAFKALAEKFGPDIASATINFVKDKVINPIKAAPSILTGGSGPLPTTMGFGPFRANPLYTVPATGTHDPDHTDPQVGAVGLPFRSMQRPYYPDPRSTLTPSREGNPLVPPSGPVLQPNPNQDDHGWLYNFFHAQQNPLLLPSRAPTA